MFARSARFQTGSRLTARSLADGTARWSIDFEDAGRPWAPVVADDTVYLTPDDGGILAYDTTGTRRWHRPAETSNRVGLAASAEETYLVDNGHLVAVDPANGTARWSVSPQQAGDAGVPSVGKDAVYLERSGFPAAFVALARANGSTRWSHRLPETIVGGDQILSGLSARPVIGKHAVYAPAYNGLYGFGPARG